MASSYDLPSTMRAAYISERAVPAIRDDELLVKVVAAGFCHSDLQVLQGRFSPPVGMIPSHEPAGIVVKIGEACAGGFTLGDRVGVLNFRRACGQCSGCRLTRRTTGAPAADGHQHEHEDDHDHNHHGPDPRFCASRETAGFHHDGAFAEYLVADPHTTVRLPDGLSFAQAAPLMCAGATVWGSLEKATAGLSPGETVAIVGIGGLGHLGVQFAKSMGFRVVAVDSRAAGRQLAREATTNTHTHLQPQLQADYVVDSADLQAATDEIFCITDSEGLATAIVCTDSLVANTWALRMLRVGGALGLLGLPAEQWRFDSDVLAFRELTVHGSYVAGRASTERMLQCVQSAGIQSHVNLVEWVDIPRIVAMYEDEEFRGRLVVRINDALCH